MGALAAMGYTGYMELTHAIEVIRSSRLSRHADLLTEHLMPSARLQVASDSATHPAGTTSSYFGGLPYLEAGDTWPCWNRASSLKAEIARLEAKFAKNPRATGLRDIAARKREELSRPIVPLAFLGQLNLADLRSVVPLPGWPGDGILAFFYTWTEGAWGFDPLHRGHCRVLYCSTMQELTVMPAPADLPDEAKFPQRSISFVPEWTLPTAVETGELKLPIGSDDDYRDLCQQLMSTADDKSPIHRCGGHPQEIQGDMRLECQLVTNGMFCGDPSGYRDPRAPLLAQGAAEWQLLLQIDSDEERLGWMWGDAGRVYFWARREGIARRAFDGARAVLQCY